MALGLHWVERGRNMKSMVNGGDMKSSSKSLFIDNNN